MHTPDRITPSAEQRVTPSDKHARIMKVGPLMSANRSLSEDMGSTEAAIKASKSEKPMNMVFHGGSLAEATAFYEGQQQKKNAETAKAEERMAELKAEQSLMLEAANKGLMDPTDWLSGEEERLAIAQSESFRLKQQLEMSHAHGRGAEQVIGAKKLEELREEMKSNANRMGAIVRLRNRL